MIPQTICLQRIVGGAYKYYLPQLSQAEETFDAVAWCYARQADVLGVDIIQGCAVNNMLISQNRVQGVKVN